MSKDIVDLGPPVISPTEQGYKLEWRPGPHTLYCFHISPAQAEAMIVGLLELVDQDRGGALRVRGNTRRWDGQPAERETWQVERLQWIKILGQYSTDGKAYDALREARPAMCEDRQSSRGSGEIIDGDDHFRDAGEIPPGSPLSDRVEQLEDELIAEEFDHHEALAIMIERGRRLDAIAEILELGDRRLLASDGPAGEQPPDLTLDEFRRMYLLAKGHDPDNELAGLVPVFVKTTDGQPLDRDRA